jgi:archaellum component FlaC
MEDVVDLAEGLVSDFISKGVQKIASRKKLTSQDLTVLLLHEQNRTISRMEKGMDRIEKGIGGLENGMGGLQKGMERLERGMDGIASELREFRRDVVPLLNQARDIADIRARMERIEAKLT